MCGALSHVSRSLPQTNHPPEIGEVRSNCGDPANKNLGKNVRKWWNEHTTMELWGELCGMETRFLCCCSVVVAD